MSMNKWHVFTLLLIVAVIFLALVLTYFKEESPKLISLMKSDSPIVGIEKIDENRFLLTFMKSLVEHEDRTTVYFGEGKISVVRINQNNQNIAVKELWNYTLSRYSIFSFSCITNESIIIATVGSPNAHKYSEILRISLDNYKIEKIVTLKDKTILVTGFDVKKKVGKVILIRNSSKIFEEELGNKTIGSLIFDVNKDGRDDFIVSNVIFDDHNTSSFISIFMNALGGFKETKRIEIPDEMIWDMKFVNLGKKEIALFSPKSIHLLNLTSGKVKKIFETEKGYYLSSVETFDFDHDGFDEFFGVYHNETQSYFVELKYSKGTLFPIFKHPVNLKGFIVKWMRDGDFLIGSVEGLYITSI